MVDSSQTRKNPPTLDAEAARAKTERLINVRDRSEKELADRLRQAGFSAQIIKAEVARAVAAGLVDNERFTRLFISGKVHKGWGQQRIVREISRFGIDLQQQDGYPEEFFSEEDELSRAIICVENFHSRSKNPYHACFQKLMSRGFSVATARKALIKLTIRPQ